MDQTVTAPAAFRIPPVIKRNTILFALSQSFTGAGMQFAYGLGPLMVVALTGSAGLAGLSVALIGLSRFLVAYPMGRITDQFGRKPGIYLGLVLALCGAVTVGISVNIVSPVLFVIGMLGFGMGMNGAQQMRVAATDMFPPNRRAQALGYVALGSLVGLIISPVVISTSDHFARRLGQDPLALPWFAMPVLIVAGMALVRFVRPDPKEIGQNLAAYYPGYVAPPRVDPATRPPFSAAVLLRDPTIRLAVLCNCAGQGNMSIIMVLTSLVLHHHGHSLGAIAFSHMFHSAGMFAFTIPLGKLADRIGRVRVMLPGVAVALGGAVFVTYAESYAAVTLGTFLVGLGWAASNVASTALIADRTETVERGRAIGVNDSFAGGISVAVALVTGPLIAWSGLPAAGLTSVVLALAPIAMWPTIRRAWRHAA